MIPVLLVLLQAGASPADLPTDPGHADVFEVVPVADGVWAALVLPEPAAYHFANSLVVEGEDGSLVVDTQQSTAAARALVGWIRERTDRPVRWVVNTHWHGDHVYGNQAYREAFPDVTIVGHQATREALAEEGAAYRRDELAELPAGHGERVRILPAHGGLQAEASLLEWQAAFMAALVEMARRARSEGWSAAEAGARMDVAPFRDGFSSVGLEGGALEDYLTGAVEEALADPSSPG